MSKNGGSKMKKNEKRIFLNSVFANRAFLRKEIALKNGICVEFWSKNYTLKQEYNFHNNQEPTGALEAYYQYTDYYIDDEAGEWEASTPFPENLIFVSFKEIKEINKKIITGKGENIVIFC